MAGLSRTKLFYKIGEVSSLAGVEPYILRYWESEFPALSPKKNRGGQRVYQKKDLDLVLHIKRMLHEEGYTISGARKKLAGGRGARAGPGVKGDQGDTGGPCVKGDSESLVKLRDEIKDLLDIIK